MQSIVTSFNNSRDEKVIKSLQQAGYDKAEATKLVAEFPGFDLIDLADELTRAKQEMSGLKEEEIAERVVEFGKGVTILYRKKRNKKPPKGSLVDDLVVGISLLTALTERLEREFRRSASIAAPTFTGSGWYTDAGLGSLSRFTSQLHVVSRSLHQLTELAHVFRANDILRDLEDLRPTHDHEVEAFAEDNHLTAFFRLWWQWCWGYGVPGQYITGNQDDADRFAPWRYISWGTYFQRALYFYSAAAGKKANHVYSGVDGKHMQEGRAKKLFTASWESIQERVQLSLPAKVNDRLRSLYTTKPLPHRRTTVSRTPQKELALQSSGEWARRPVKVWRCSSCPRELQPFDMSHNSMSKYDSYICPTWHNCGGILRPLLNDS